MRTTILTVAEQFFLGTDPELVDARQTFISSIRKRAVRKGFRFGIVAGMICGAVLSLGVARAFADETKLNIPVGSEMPGTLNTALSTSINSQTPVPVAIAIQIASQGPICTATGDATFDLPSERAFIRTTHMTCPSGLSFSFKATAVSNHVVGVRTTIASEHGENVVSVSNTGPIILMLLSPVESL